MKDYYKSLDELKRASLLEKIDTFLYVNAKSAEESYKRNKNNESLIKSDFEERNIKIGSLVKGEAYNHETGKYYDVVGFMIETEIEYNGKREIVYGMRSIYFDTDDIYAPIDFDEGYSLEPFGEISDFMGNYVSIDEEIVTSDEVNECIKNNNIDINKYLKEVNLFLSSKKRWKINDRSFSGRA